MSQPSVSTGGELRIDTSTIMRFENQNRYKQYIPQESTRPFLPILMVKTDNLVSETRNLLKQVDITSQQRVVQDSAF